MKITAQELAATIDHSLLKPTATRDDLRRLCAEALEHGFKTVCVNPVHVAEAAARLRDSAVWVCSVAGFPLGASSAVTKAFETRELVKAGAREIDMVIRVGALKEGRDREVADDIRAVVEAAAGCPVKVILENCFLSEPEKRRGCLLCVEAGAAFVKTSTGFAESGATVGDVRLMRETVGPDFGIKAAGGIKTLKDALAMLAAGASRLGTSSSVAIMDEFRQQAGAHRS